MKYLIWIPVALALPAVVNYQDEDQSTDSYSYFAYIADEMIYLQPAEGGAPLPAGSNTGKISAPTWSPDGEKIAVMRDEGEDTNRDIYVLDLTTEEWTRITDDPASDVNPSWSPDGEKLLFVSERDGNREIYVKDLESGDVTRLTDNAANDHGPVWSPDGETIAFYSNRIDEVYGIYIMDVDGENVELIYQGEEASRSPAWGPDSQRILFWEATVGFWVIDVAEKSMVAVEDLAPGAWSPSWSPAMDEPLSLFGVGRLGDS